MKTLKLTLLLALFAMMVNIGYAQEGIKGINRKQPVIPPKTPAENPKPQVSANKPITKNYLKIAKDCFNAGDYEKKKKNYRNYKNYVNNQNVNEQIQTAQDCLNNLNLADGYFQNGDYEKARDQYKSIVDVNPNDPVAKARYNICVTQITAANNVTLLWNAIHSVQSMLEQAVSTNPTYSYGNGKYKGQMSNGQRNGLGIYNWNTGDFYFGGWQDDNRQGYSILIAPTQNMQIANCQNCTFYVGNWVNNQKSGTGTCYDKTGKLIYYGGFVEDKPTGTYPISSSDFDKFRFQVFEWNDGQEYDGKYVGETVNGKREGMGIYVWKTGEMWYGPWKDGLRNGYGIRILVNGATQTGTWNDDTYTP